jgi:hypothetical protein
MVEEDMLRPNELGKGQEEEEVVKLNGMLDIWKFECVQDE